MFRPNTSKVMADEMALHWANVILHWTGTGYQHWPNKMPLCKVILIQNRFPVWAQLNLM